MIRCRAKAVSATLTLFLGFAGYTSVSSSADAQTQTSSTTICDILTAHPDDAQRVADPVPSAERDGARAVPACEEAVRRDPNNMRLRYQLGLAHDSAGNHAESIRHYAAAAERGYVAAGMALGWALANGEGVPRDDANAVRWYRWAADRGHSGAANTLGFMYENGRGVPRDYTQAANWYRRAYEGGRRPIAGFNLARLMSAGRGTPRDPQRAAVILRALAQEGRQDAALHLALMAERNEVPQVSLGEYLQLLALAETRSVEQARARQSLDRAIGQGYAAEVAQARRQAADRQAAAAREEEQRRQRLEAAYAAVGPRGGGSVATGRAAQPGVPVGPYPEPVIQAEIGVPQRLGPGEAFTVSWTITGNTPPRPPLRRAPASAGQGGAAQQMLFDLNQRWLSGSRRELVVVTMPEAVRVAGRGFIVVPPGARMPYGIEYEPDRLKVVFPLHLAESQNAGQVRVRAFMAGSVDIRVTLLTVPRDGVVETSRDLAQRTMELVDDRPVLLVQDRITSEQPRERWLSPRGRGGDSAYELRVWTDHFSLHFNRNGEEIARLSGRNPTFTSGGRFIVYSYGNTVKIFDNLAREIFRSQESVDSEGVIYSAFLFDDSYIFLPRKNNISANILSPFIDEDEQIHDIVEPVVLGRIAPQGLGWTSQSGFYYFDSLVDLDYFLVGGFHSRIIPLFGAERDYAAWGRPSAQILQSLLGASFHASAPSVLGRGRVDPHRSNTAIRSNWRLPSWIGRGADLRNEMLGREPPEGYFHRAAQSAVDIAPIRHVGDGVVGLSGSNSDNRTRGISIDLVEREERNFARPEFRGSELYQYLSQYNLNFYLDGTIYRKNQTFDRVSSSDIGRQEGRLRQGQVNGVSALLSALPGNISQRVDVRRLLGLRDDIWGGAPNFGFVGFGRDYPALSYVRSTILRRSTVWSWSGRAGDVSLVRIHDTARDGSVSDDLSFRDYAGRHAWCLFSQGSIGQSLNYDLCSRDIPLDSREFDGDGEPLNPDVYRIAVSQDGLQVALAMMEGDAPVIRVFDIRKGISAGVRIVAGDFGAIGWVCGDNMVCRNQMPTSLAFSSDGRRVLQTNLDGRFFIYDTVAGVRILSGLSIDDEFVIYDEYGFYDATSEGGSYVYRFYPGLREHHSFAQFRAQFYRPDIVRNLIVGHPVSRPGITLLAPPTVEFEARPDPAGSGRVDLSFDLRGSAQLRTLRLFRDGLPLAELAVSGNTARLSHTVQLQPGRHNISAVAYDARGFSSNVKTAAVQIGQDRRYNGRLRYVGIAVDNYHRMAANQNLAFAVRDAQLMRDSLLELRATRRGEIGAIVLANAQATRTAILETLRQAAAETGPDDTLVISFAGHGARVGDRFYYLPHGGSFADATESGVEWRLIAEALVPAQGRVLVLLDACHSGSASGDAIVPNDAYAEQLMSSGRAGLAVLAAAKGRQFSYEDRSLGGGHGFFSYMIAQALVGDRATADRDRSGTIELDELYAYVKRNVGERTRSFPSGAQTPWLAREEFIGRVSLF